MQMFLLIVLISEVGVILTKIRHIQALGGVWYIRAAFLHAVILSRGMLRFCQICEQARAADVKWNFSRFKNKHFLL